MAREEDDNPFKGIFAKQLRHFDNEMQDFRQFYDAIPAEERPALRAWLEKANALAQESKWNLLLRVKVEHDILDEHGETARWADVEFSPATLLSAMAAWEKGKPFTPDSPMP